jgi:hypothetical protein
MTCPFNVYLQCVSKICADSFEALCLPPLVNGPILHRWGFFVLIMLNITNEDNMNLMARYPDKYFDLAIVDPSYGIGEDGGKCRTRGSKKNKWNKKELG